MGSMHVPGQEMDEGLEEMWTESTQGITSIDPGTCWWHIIDVGACPSSMHVLHCSS